MALTFPSTVYAILPYSIARRINYFFDFFISITCLCIGRILPSLRGHLSQNPHHLSGKTAIITGANSGIGLQIALDLSHLGARVILACRNVQKGEEALRQIIDADPSAKIRVELRKLDTSSLESVKEFAHQWQSQSSDQQHIDILVHNAGIAGAAANASSAFSNDGFELTYATSFLGSFLLTYLLEDRLSDNARVIFTSSTGQYGGRISSSFSIDSVKNKIEPGFHTLKPRGTTPAVSSSTYSMTKSMQCVLARCLQARWDRNAQQSGTRNRRIAHSFTPGFTMTPIFGKFEVKSIWTEPMFAILQVTTWLGTHVSEGAATGSYLASTDDSDVVRAEKGGRYWDRCTARMATADLFSQTVLDRLWRRWEVDAGVEWR